MKTYVIGDIHGAGLELQDLYAKLPIRSGDTLAFVGDVFDRGEHAYLVWEFIQQIQPVVYMGNHEYKMLQWMSGKRDWLPLAYYVAMNNLVENGVSPQELFEWLKARPLLGRFPSFIVAHAAVDPSNPYQEDVSWNVYGNPPGVGADGQPRPYFWDIWDGEELVVYGHLVSIDNLPRIRRNKRGRVNSVGLDTAAVHGGPLTCICVEDFAFYSHQSGIDWSSRVKAAIQEKRPLINGLLMNFVASQREQLKARLEAEKGKSGT